MNSLLGFVSALDYDTKNHGNHNENNGQRILYAGQISMVYEQGNLRYLSLGNHEVIRMIYTAVRNKAWLTIKPEIFDEEYYIQTDSFRIVYRCKYKSGDIDFSAIHMIEGNANNSLTYIFEGEAKTTFQKNRIGFCVLHPIEVCAGKYCTVIHSNNDSETLNFPQLISPHQPFVDVKAIKWKAYGHNCVLNFYGDIFETEDQRNWTDASFKTYCTPLCYPYPVWLQKGDKIYQRIELKIKGDYKQGNILDDHIKISIHPEEIFGIPRIGISQSTRPEPLTKGEIQIFKRLRFDHYRIDLYLFSEDWKVKAEPALDEASRLEYPVEFALFFDDDFLNQSALFIDWVSFIHQAIALIIIFHKTHKTTTDLLTDTLAPLFKEALPGVMIGCGTNANFAQLNRNRPESVHHDYICYSIHPQEHSSDNSTLVENLQAQKYTVESARNFAKCKEIWISPINIQRRFNANIENFEQNSGGADFPAQVDSRLMSLFGACWTIGTLKYLIEGGIKGMTIFETVGERGIIQGDFPSRWPDRFQSVKGMIFPVYFVLDYLFRHKSFKVISSNCSHQLKVNSLILTDGKDLKLILVNFTSVQQQVSIHSYSGSFKIKQLNNETYANAVSDINWIENTSQTLVLHNEYLVLSPFSINFVDGCLNHLNV